MSAIQTIKVPQPVPVTTTRFRPPKKNIPQTKQERDALLAYIREYVAQHNPVPPMPLDELEVHAKKIIAETGFDEIYLHYTAVNLNNEMWRETLATIPYERRLLLMPKCLRVEDKCPAPFDEFGLLCKQCGLCTIQDFQNEAERLGYAVLVAEGSAIVMSLIQTGQIEAIVGISCLPVLERTFPYVEAAAIPSIAVPLLQDDCIDTTVDIDWVWEYLHLTADDKTRRLNLNALHDDVREWFKQDKLEDVFGEGEGETERIARDWVARDGKRWRPYLTVAGFQALREDRDQPIPDDIRTVAAAVECFHKASLIHDDIEDEDDGRYDQPTMHVEHGTAVALNAGDLLIGEGYRLITESSVSAEQKAQMLKVAAEGQRELCRGQGAELIWAKNPKPLTRKEVLEIFRQKTSPAFEVALKLGAAYAGVLKEYAEPLRAYSEALGIAYQVRDDMDDLSADSGTGSHSGTGFQPVSGGSEDTRTTDGAESASDAEQHSSSATVRPSILLATTWERAKGEDKEFMEQLWNGRISGSDPEVLKRVRQLAHSTGADEKCMLDLETYKDTAIRSLQDVDNQNLKGLLRRVLGKIFNDLEIKGWCHEFEEANGIEVSPREEATMA